MEETISLKEIYDTVKKRLPLIVTITIFAAFVATVVSFFVLTPIYQSSSQFIVNQSKDQETNQIDSGTIRTNVDLINTYNVIITSRAILSGVIEELDLDMKAEDLAKKITVSSEQNSQVVTVSVKDPHPTQATEIANTVVSIFQDEIVDIMNVDNVSILTEAYTPADPSPVAPNKKLNVAIAVVLGLMVGVGLAFLLDYMDTTIRTQEDAEKVFKDLPIIGAISTIDTKDARPQQQTLTRNRKVRGHNNV